jgi:hypothetical protein
VQPVEGYLVDDADEPLLVGANVAAGYHLEGRRVGRGDAEDGRVFYVLVRDDVDCVCVQDRYL